MSERIDIKGWFHDDQECISAELAEAYQAGKLQGAEKHAVERHLLTCDLCAEAWEGIEAATVDGTLKAAVADITEQAWQRAEARERKKRRGAWIWMTSAAGIALLVVVGYFLFQGGQNRRMDEAFAQQFEKYPAQEEMAPATELESKEKNTEQPGADEANGDFSGLTQKYIAPDMDEMEMEDVVAENVNKDRFAMADDAPPAPPKYLPPVKTKELAIYDMEMAEQEESDAIEQKTESQMDKVGAEDLKKQPNNEITATFADAYTPKTTSLNNPIYSADQVEVLEEVTVKATREKAWTKKGAEKEKTAAPTQSASPKRTSTSGKGDYAFQAKPQNTPTEKQNRKDNSSDDMDGGIASGVDVGASRDEMEGVVMDSISTVNYYAAGRKQYDAGDYAGAYRNMEQELAVHPQNMDAKLYAGLSQLIQEKPAQALPYFRDVASSPSATATQREDAEWYAALSLLKMKDKEKATTLLRGIVAKNGRYALKAQQTLDTMD